MCPPSRWLLLNDLSQILHLKSPTEDSAEVELVQMSWGSLGAFLIVLRSLRAGAGLSAMMSVGSQVKLGVSLGVGPGELFCVD